MPETSTALQYQAFIECPQLWLKDQAPFQLFEIPPDTGGSPKDESNSHIVFGKRMETFFSHAINQSDRFEMIAENLQIISHKTTLGEIDFLIKDLENGQLMHVELACKVYLYDPKRVGTVLSHWVGPNQNDFLDKKVEKLKSKQLPLLYSDESKTLLSQYIKEEDISAITQTVCFPANLYLPKNSDADTSSINPKAISGSWVSLSDFSEGLFKGCLFHLPEKQYWLMSPSMASQWSSYEEILIQIKELHQRKKSPLVWLKHPNETFERLFVVWW